MGIHAQTTHHTEHGPLAIIARFSVRRRRLVMLLWLVVVLAAAPLALSLTSALSGAGWELRAQPCVTNYGETSLNSAQNQR
jgi:hypothetical protein